MSFPYYDDQLSAERLRQVYEIAPPRVRQYLDAEIRHVLSRVNPSDTMLELGCGYGRVMLPLAGKAAEVHGIDTSLASLHLAQIYLAGRDNVRLACMDAADLGYADHQFDVVICMQNGISAFHIDQRRLIAESLRVTKPGGLVLFSSYTDTFWIPRLQWFELQAQRGLLGEIDYEKTGNGVIVCKDGFTATTVTADDFRRLTVDLGLDTTISEVDSSSLFCEIRIPRFPEHG
ncbi:MAG: class I SAM-dependent methyltransferase [Candidatus Zixiibacteriota bacterium]